MSSTFDPFYETGERAFHQMKFVEYTSANKARVYRTGQAEPSSLLHHPLSQLRPQDDCIVVVPFTGFSPLQTQEGLEQVVRRWGVPGEMYRHLVQNQGGDRFEVHAEGFRWRTWRIPVGAWPWALLTSYPTYFAVGTPLGDDDGDDAVAAAAPLRVLAFVAKDRVSKTEVALKGYVGADLAGVSCELRLLYLQALLIMTVNDNWHNCTESIKRSITRNMSALRDARKNVSYSESMGHASEYQFVSITNMVYLKSIIEHAGAVASAASIMSLPEKSPSRHRELLLAVRDIARNSQQQFRDNLTAFTALREALDGELRNCAVAVQNNSLDYVRQSLIDMRQVSRSSQKQAEEMHKYAEQAKEDTRYMRRLALITMCFLPSSTVAAMFSMPFLSLDDDLSFKAIRKFWIFVVVSLVFTGLTFGVSFSWDLLSRIKASRNGGAKQQQQQQGKEEQDVDNAGDDLRPRPHVDVELSEMATILMSRLPVREGPDSDGDDDDDKDNDNKANDSSNDDDNDNKNGGVGAESGHDDDAQLG
ncbi:hypothetical protein JDV02_002533 [Purpureocillium takamizusanense]|uniref:Uncharacterized protein n=1 Tax=Purpureocillium takamizusanense TaxID=2060973 RepID=A0A9Q8Q9J8_9HYPO|nr:uncharacterized protein JDV02_002533 [Purpureocillium takamizusanense]UNI16058.1 hypothetical protein JDV02_002533 [Purpureocillium takamizusanense]